MFVLVRVADLFSISDSTSQTNVLWKTKSYDFVKCALISSVSCKVKSRKILTFSFYSQILTINAVFDY